MALGASKVGRHAAGCAATRKKVMAIVAEESAREHTVLRSGRAEAGLSGAVDTTIVRSVVYFVVWVPIAVP